MRKGQISNTKVDGADLETAPPLETRQASDEDTNAGIAFRDRGQGSEIWHQGHVQANADKNEGTRAEKTENRKLSQYMATAYEGTELIARLSPAEHKTQ